MATLSIQSLFYKFTNASQALYFFYLISGYIILNFDSYNILEQYCDTSYSRILCAILFISCILSFCTCSLSDPGKINSDSLDIHLKLYSYDNVIFKEKCNCTTCNMLKPPRSKHCKYCSSCISRYDHHCYIFNNCIGGYNIIYFLIFIIMHLLICSYALYIASFCLYSVIKHNNILKATFIHSENNMIMPNSWFTIMKYLFSKHNPTFSLCVISIILMFCLVLLLVYEIYYNIILNITYNEQTKYNKLKRKGFYVNKSFYNKGFIKNLKGVLFFQKNVENFLKKDI
ncbi:palmitoyltransferase, putative [Hepatocystis sp. ex Piliocolobus tephrosceles]|nr:palmitoyltransferase, putative [Hepatocystis sp. ex Piliocolobus tephrosceles]